MRDNRSTIAMALLIVALTLLMMTVIASADPRIGVSARAAALYEPWTDTFVYTKNANDRLPMASTTKIMTALLAIEEGDLSSRVLVDDEDVGIEGSSLYLKPGDELSLKDLVYSLLLQSANDAACVIAKYISGSCEGFVELMNKRAGELGLSDTSFANPHGLDDEEHYTTARDLAILASTAMSNKTFESIASTYRYSFYVCGKKRTVVNHNKLLNRYEGAIGVKTGYTKRSGRCLVSSAERDGVTLICVTLDAPDDWRDHTMLLDEGFQSFESVDPASLSDLHFEIPVINTKGKSSITAIADLPESFKLIKLKGSENLRACVDLDQFIVAPISTGDKVGEITYMTGDEEYGRIDIIAAEEAEEAKRHNIFDFIFRR